MAKRLCSFIPHCVSLPASRTNRSIPSSVLVKPISLRDCSRRVAALLMLVVWCNSLLLNSLALGAPIPANKPAHYPAWWFSQEVIPRIDVNKAAPSWPGDYRQADDYAVINQGQLKNIALAAFRHLQLELTDGPGPEITGLIDAWTQLNADNLRVPKTSAATDDFAAVNIGQLKAVAKPFYDRLQRAYPWNPATPVSENYAPANLGQLKLVFSFDLAAAIDTDGDQLPDWWELSYGFDPYTPIAGGADFDQDGVPDLAEFLSGKHPTKKDNPVLGLTVYGFTAP